MDTASAGERIVVPAREGRAVLLRPGRRVAVVDLEGGQVGDVFVIARENSSERHSAAHTRAHVNRLFPRIGEQFVTNLRRPVLTLVEDSSPGCHDMLIPACDPARYTALGAPDHASCARNFRIALAGTGHDPLDAVPQPINVFMDIPVRDDGLLEWKPAPSRPGDRITFDVMMDCVFVVSACPQDIVGINGGRPTALAIDLVS